MKEDKSGRPTKFNPERISSILHSISKHVPYRIAAQANGIGERTLYYWLKQGIDDMNNGIESDYSRFLQSLSNIEQERIIECIKLIKESHKGHRGCQWLLEHVFWKYFSSSTANIEFNERLIRLENDY